MANSNHDSDQDIPVLDDLVLVDAPDDLDASETSASAANPQANAMPEQELPAMPDPGGSPKFSFEMPGSTKPLPRNNPFLPYEHLEQLARERVEFQKQFSQFAVAQQSQRPLPLSITEPRPAGWNNYSASQTAPSPNQQVVLDNLARQLTQEVVSELRPQIEKRIRELLDERFGELSATSAPGKG